MIFKKTNLKSEIAALKKCTVCTWNGYKQQELIVTIDDKGERINLQYYFSDRKDYSWFINQLRRLEHRGSCS